MSKFLVVILVEAPNMAVAASNFLWDDSGESMTSGYLDFRIEQRD